MMNQYTSWSHYSFAYALLILILRLVIHQLKNEKYLQFFLLYR